MRNADCHQPPQVKCSPLFRYWQSQLQARVDEIRAREAQLADATASLEDVTREVRAPFNPNPPKNLGANGDG